MVEEWGAGERYLFACLKNSIICSAQRLLNYLDSGMCSGKRDVCMRRMPLSWEPRPLTLHHPGRAAPHEGGGGTQAHSGGSWELLLSSAVDRVRNSLQRNAWDTLPLSCHLNVHFYALFPFFQENKSLPHSNYFHSSFVKSLKVQ
jgi:hypothetical protein